jgi:hypothetical protein
MACRPIVLGGKLSGFACGPHSAHEFARGQGQVEGEVVLVAHRRRIAREPQRRKFWACALSYLMRESSI